MCSIRVQATLGVQFSDGCGAQLNSAFYYIDWYRIRPEVNK